MAKRFTDTDKYKKPFLRAMPGAYKLLWDYICNDCNHAGIWIVDFEIAQMYVGSDMKINKAKALQLFNSDKIRVIEIKGGKYWFIFSFIEFQYGILNPLNRAHNSVINCLSSYDLWDDIKNKIKPLESPFQGAMDKDKDKEMEMDKEIYGDINKDYIISDSDSSIVDVVEVHLTWKDDFNIYVDELREAYNLLIRDKEFLEQQQKYHPNLNIKLTLEKACVNFWATEAGWANKKKTKTKTINWKTTLTNSLSQTQNKVYYERENGNSKNSKSAVSDSYKAEILRAMGVIPSTGDV